MSINRSMDKEDMGCIYNEVLCCCVITKSCLTLATPLTIAHQVPLPMGFPRQEYWSGLPFPSPGDIPDPEIEPKSPALACKFFTTEPPGKPINRWILPFATIQINHEGIILKWSKSDNDKVCIISTACGFFKQKQTNKKLSKNKPIDKENG